MDILDTLAAALNALAHTRVTMSTTKKRILVHLSKHPYAVKSEICAAMPDADYSRISHDLSELRELGYIDATKVYNNIKSYTLTPAGLAALQVFITRFIGEIDKSRKCGNATSTPDPAELEYSKWIKPQS